MAKDQKLEPASRVFQAQLRVMRDLQRLKVSYEGQIDNRVSIEESSHTETFRSYGNTFTRVNTDINLTVVDPESEGNIQAGLSKTWAFDRSGNLIRVDVRKTLREPTDSEEIIIGYSSVFHEDDQMKKDHFFRSNEQTSERWTMLFKPITREIQSPRRRASNT